MLRRAFLLVVLALSCTLTTFAWNRAGHMVTGVVAYKELQASNPTALRQIVALLKQHPDYPKWESQISQQQLASENSEMYLFALAARWADDVRQSSYDHPSWHYINYPVVPPGQASLVTAPPPAPENIVKAFETNLAIVNSNAPAADRAVALCWIFHLTGDVHQPLHTTALFSSDYPKGDRGGNSIYIRVKPESSTINLHGFWDDLVLGSDRFQSTTNRATELRVTYNRRKLVELTAKQFTEWARESFGLAVKYAYRNGAIKGGASKDDGVALPGDYVQLTKPIAEHRVTLAGYRLADTLATIASGVNVGRGGSAQPRGNTLPQGNSNTPSAPVIGNKNSHIYHLSSCPDYEKIGERNRVRFKTEAEAQQAGFRKARNCP